MATNLFDAFDSAFAPPARPVVTHVATQVFGWLAGLKARRAAAREQAKMLRVLTSLPEHLLKDMGYPGAAR